MISNHDAATNLLLHITKNTLEFQNKQANEAPHDRFWLNSERG